LAAAHDDIAGCQLSGCDMSDRTLNVITICGSLRKASYNAALMRALPALAPPGLSIKPAPAWEKFPVYNADLQASSGFPADVEAWADAIRSADGVIIVSPEYNWGIPGGLKNAIDWASRLKEVPYREKPVALHIRCGWRWAQSMRSSSASRKSSSISQQRNSMKRRWRSRTSRRSRWSSNNSPVSRNSSGG
jgi:hypothetical protein